MLSFVPVTLDLYRTVKRHLHWTLQNLVAYADRDGRCFPSVRTLASVTDIPKSTVSRHLAQLAKLGIITRQRRPGGCYAYVIDGRFLPDMRGVSHAEPEVSHQSEKPVPPGPTEEKDSKNKEGGARAFSAKPVSHSPGPHDQWRRRVESWRRSAGKFWLAQWGNTPDQPGHLVPIEVIKEVLGNKEVLRNAKP